MTTSTEKRHQTLAILTIALNELHFGISFGWIAPTINKLRITNTTTSSELHFTEENVSWIASLEHLGKIFGCLVPFLLMDTVGRKLILISCAFLYFLLWSVVSIVNTVWLLYCTRFFFGVVRGANNTVNSVYLGEISSPSLRGVFGTLILSMYHVGLLFEYSLASFLPYRPTAIVNTCVAAVTIVSVYWLVEPAQFLLLRNRTQQAERNYAWLRGVVDLATVKHDFEKVKQNVQAERSKRTSVKRLFASNENRKSLLIVVLIYTLPYLTGYTAVITFSTMVLRSNLLSVYLGVIGLLVCFVSLYTIHRYNRRFLLVCSFASIAAVQACTSVLFYVYEHVAPLLVFVSFAIYISALGLVYPVIFTIRGEVLPISIKATGGCIAIIANCVVNFVSVKTFLSVAQQYGMYANFVAYSLVSVVVTFFVYFCVPETRNKSLTQIQDELSGGVVVVVVAPPKDELSAPAEGRQLL